jgi:CDP-diglyceride synthetase
MLVPLILLAIYYGHLWVLAFIVLLLVALGGWEWTQLIPINALFNKCIFVGILILISATAGLLPYDGLIGGLILWGLILLAELTFPASQTLWGYRPVVAGSCLILMPLFASTIVAIYQKTNGKDLLVYLLCIVWAADTGAYLVGKRFGRHKLIPLISPGKTIEGLVGGFVLAMLVAFIGQFYFKPNALSVWYLLAMATAFISMVGDLFISMLKRRSKLKDTGNIFPGHGGVLDRIDSLIAASPLFYWGLSWL